jgi:hypothetical protein
LKAIQALLNGEVEISSGLEGRLPPQPGCPAGDPGLAPLFFYPLAQVSQLCQIHPEIKTKKNLEFN